MENNLWSDCNRDWADWIILQPQYANALLGIGLKGRFSEEGLNLLAPGLRSEQPDSTVFHQGDA